MRRVAAALVAVATTTIVWAGGQTAAPATAPEERASVAFVGDSIGRDAEPEIRANVERTNPLTYYHAIAAGYTTYHLHADPDGSGPQRNFLATVRAADGPDIVVAELGTGDAFWSHGPARFEADMRAFLDAVTPHVECVVWIDQKPSRNRAYPMINARAAAFNRVVHRVVRDYDEVTYLHYAAWTQLAGSPSPYFLADWLHLTQAGERELGRLVGSAVRGCDPDLRTGPFWDVDDDFWAADAINWAAEQGIVTGADNDSYRAVIGQFRPKVTRGQAAQMLWRFKGSVVAPGPHGWTDSEPWLTGPLRWGAATHVLTGYPNHTFRPSVLVTRGQLVGWLWRAAGRPGGFPASGFPDSTPAMRAALNWAKANDIVTAINGRFAPSQPVDRAQIAAWLYATDAFLHPEPPPSTTLPPATTAPPTTLPPATTEAPTTVPPATTVP